MINIFCLDNSELAEYKALNRGFRGDIYIEVSNRHYQLNIYDLVRLEQDFETELEEYGVYSAEPNLVLVKEVSTVEIKKLVHKLYLQKYFEEIKPVDEKNRTT